MLMLIISVSTFSFVLGRMTAAGENETSTLSLSETELNEINSTNTGTSVTTTPSGPQSPTPQLRTKIINSEPELDGFRTSINTGNDAKEIVVGRNKNYVSRGFLSFDITQIPDGAIVNEARLRIFQNSISGNPQKAGIIIKVDHLTFGDNLDLSDYGMPAISSGFANLELTGSTGAWKETEVTGKVRDDLANARSHSQFRLHFQTELTRGTEEGDFVFFESSDNTNKTGNLPELVINYY